MQKVTKIVLATSLILGLSGFASAAQNYKRDRATHAIKSDNNDISGIKFLLGAGVGTGLSADAGNGGFSIQLAPNPGLDAKLKLGTGIFTTTSNSTLGLQATIGVGANALGSGTGFNPQYSVNLDFIQAFKIGSGYVKLGYILGAGVAIRTHDSGSNRSGSFSGDTIASGAAVFDDSMITGDINDVGKTTVIKQQFGEVNKKIQDLSSQITSQANTIKTQFQNGNISQGVSGFKQIQGLASQINALGFNWNNRFPGSRGSVPVFANSLGSTYSDQAVKILKPVALSSVQSQVSSAETIANEAKTLAGNPSQASNIQQAAEKIQQASTKLAMAKNNLQSLQNVGIIDSNDYTSTISPGDNAVTQASNTLKTTGTIGAQAAQIANLQQQLADANRKATEDSAKQATEISSLQAQLKEILDQARIAASQSAAELEAERKRREASAKNVPTILPTLKAGLIAFIGKHQAVSLEYQYYFRNTVQGMASSDISLNYTYYFGGK
ncbi:hypothetical protein [Helicobacter sp. 11S02629-2]|uniref:hypothetical protein n=1 Tax=Helicobacter sp. 11S02629-2 TaxID=1476195 RepID=UPI000BA65CA2|nr:hypothetical protein [Helicobacter sp. 11S02629-2]PAF42389.1 hypothetical protein BKH40_07915 [Helicobacter sp. 11S02629-2]